MSKKSARTEELKGWRTVAVLMTGKPAGVKPPVRPMRAALPAPVAPPASKRLRVRVLSHPRRVVAPALSLPVRNARVTRTNRVLTAGIVCLPAQISQPGLGYNPLSGQLLSGAPNSTSLTSCQWTSSPALCWVSPRSLFYAGGDGPGGAAGCLFRRV